MKEVRPGGKKQGGKREQHGDQSNKRKRSKEGTPEQHGNHLRGPTIV